MSELVFTGEYMVPGRSPERIQQDHVARYQFAAKYCIGKRVLDIACGAGYGTAMLGDSGATSVDGVDLNEDVIQYARSEYQRPNVQFLTGNIETYANGAAKYEVVTCFETIEHVLNFPKVLQNLHGLLSRTGLLIISSPNRPVTSPASRSLVDPPANTFHTQEFTPGELREALLEQGFREVKRTVYGQRLRPLFGLQAPNRIYDRLFRPDIRASATVRPTRSLCPRYFTLLATK